jgi:type I restriction enzyme R subunit
MDFRSNSDKFADPNFNGPAEVIIDVDGGNGDKTITGEDYGILVDPPIQKPISGEVEDGESKKIYIKDVPVSILNETVKYYDADGKLITESIVEYSGKNLKRLYAKFEDFQQEWYSADSKKDFLNSLYNEGVMIDALYDKANDNVDIFDILSNMAYSKDVISKDERIEKAKDSEFIAHYNEQQKDVISELLNTYKNHDVVELENIRILEIKNFNKFGGLVPVVNLFGGKDKYLNLISNIKKALYS